MLLANVSCSLFSKCMCVCYLKKGCPSAAKQLVNDVLCQQLDREAVALFRARCSLLDDEIDEAKQVCMCELAL